MERRVFALVAVVAVVALVGCRNVEKALKEADPGACDRATLVNESVVIDASGGAHMLPFNVQTQSGCSVTVTVKGMRDTGKGFDVYVIDPSEWNALVSHRQFHHAGDFYAPRTRSFTHTADLGRGSYGVVVMNSQNWFNSMEVSVTVQTAPSGGGL